MMDISTLKSDARKVALEARQHAFKADDTSCELANQNLKSFLLEHTTPRHIAGYWPMRSELSILDALSAIHHKGYHICLPMIPDENPAYTLPQKPFDDAALHFRSWDPGKALIKATFGTQVPASGAFVRPDILLVPLVGFDRDCNRLGYGGGYYDRTLQGYRRAGPTFAIGCAFAAQELRQVPVEATDQRLDAVITERDVILA